MCKSRTGERLGKFPIVQRTLFCRCCCFSRWSSDSNSQAGQAEVIILLLSSLWRVNLMLPLNRSRLNRECTLIHILKALTLIISMCNLHVTFLSEITPKVRVRVRVRVRVTLLLTVYRQSVRLGDRPIGSHNQQFFFQLNTCGRSP
jgi:hypothetical protein